MSFAAKVISETARVYCLQYDAGTKHACYFFLQVAPAKEIFFHKALAARSTTHTPADFGTILASGHGEPSEQTKRDMEAAYNITFEA